MDWETRWRFASLCARVPQGVCLVRWSWSPDPLPKRAAPAEAYSEMAAPSFSEPPTNKFPEGRFWHSTDPTTGSVIVTVHWGMADSITPASILPTENTTTAGSLMRESHRVFLKTARTIAAGKADTIRALVRRSLPHYVLLRRAKRMKTNASIPSACAIVAVVLWACCPG